jgi:tetratricopeptide (TPR) repeat protein
MKKVSRLTRSVTFAAVVLPAVFSYPESPKAQPPNADQLFSQAVQAQQGGDYAAAIRDYRELLAERPGMVDAHINLGAALAHTGDFDEAIRQYRIALPNAADKAGVRLNLGLAYYKKGDFAAAAQEFEQLRRQRPQDPQLAILLGDSEVKLSRGAEAAAMLTPLETANRANTDFEYVLGTALIAAGKRRDGVERLEKVAEATHAADTYFLAGSTQMDLNEYDAARRDFEKALELDPKLPRIYALTGMARDKTGDPAAAAEMFRKALAGNPDDFDANLYLGAILAKRRETAEAKQYLDRALHLDPASSMAQYEMALWKSTTGDYQEAAAELESIVKADPDWLEPHIELATLYYRLHRPAEGAKEREIVARLTAEKQSKGPHE